MRASVYAVVEPLSFSPRREEKGIRSRGVFHRVGQQVVHRGPRVARVGREGVSESVLEGPHQRLAKCRVVLFLHAVRNVTTPQRADAWDDAIGAIEVADDDGNGVHQLLALQAQVAVKEATQRRVEGEE